LAEVLHDHFALHAMGDGRVAWSPILLVGPAGIGKTEAARWLAGRLSIPFRVIDMASTQVRLATGRVGIFLVELGAWRGV
jgi:ATP-dependent protease Clp, ATPase subunit